MIEHQSLQVLVAARELGMITVRGNWDEMAAAALRQPPSERLVSRNAASLCWFIKIILGGSFAFFLVVSRECCGLAVARKCTF